MTSHYDVILHAVAKSCPSQWKCTKLLCACTVDCVSKGDSSTTIASRAVRPKSGKYYTYWTWLIDIVFCRSSAVILAMAQLFRWITFCWYSSQVRDGDSSRMIREDWMVLTMGCGVRVHMNSSNIGSWSYPCDGNAAMVPANETDPLPFYMKLAIGQVGLAVDELIARLQWVLSVWEYQGNRNTNWSVQASYMCTFCIISNVLLEFGCMWRHFTYAVAKSRPSHWRTEQ